MWVHCTEHMAKQDRCYILTCGWKIDIFWNHPIEGRGLMDLTVHVVLMTHHVPSVFFRSVATCFYHTTGVELKLRHLACLWFSVGLPWKPCGCGWTTFGLWSKCECAFSKQQVRSHCCWILNDCLITSVDDWPGSVKWKIYLSHDTLKRENSAQKYVVG